jgi:hypothetical protein
VWVEQIPGPAHEYARALVVHGSDVYVATNGSDGQTNTPVHLRKYGAAGDLVWDEPFDTGTPDYPALWADDSGVCIAGATAATLDGSPPGRFDDPVGFVRCLAADGSPLWTAYVEAQQGSRTPRVALFAVAGGHNAVYVVGTTYGLLRECGREGCVASGGWDAFIRKYSRDGVPGWTRQSGTLLVDYFGGVSVDQSGEVSVWGVEYGPSTPPEITVHLLRYAANGTLRQSATLPLEAQLLYDAGFAESTFCLASRPLSGTATQIRCYAWERRAGPQLVLLDLLPDASVSDVVALPSGLLVAGQVYPPLPGQAGAGYFDGFVRRYDGEQETWTLQLGTPDRDEASAVAQDASRIFVAGSTMGTMAPPTGEPTPGGTDAYVARLAEPFSAHAGGPYSVEEGSSVTLAATAVAVDYGQTLTYSWDLDGDETTFEAPGQTVTYSAADDGPVTVRVRVTDEYSLGTAEAAATVTVANVLPVVDAGEDAVLRPWQLLSRRGAFTDPGADEWTATVDYGDLSDSTVQALSDRSFTLEHSYATPGTYTVTVTVTDGDGGSGTDRFVVVVSGGAVTIQELIQAIESLVQDHVLNPGQGNSFITKLRAAQAALDAGDAWTAVERLRAFINEVEAYENARILTGAQAKDLVDMARAVIASISRPAFSSPSRLRRRPGSRRPGVLMHSHHAGS